MSVWCDKRLLHEFHITAVWYLGTWGRNCQAGQPPYVCTVSNLLYAQYLVLFGCSCFELFKFPNSALRFINVGVSAHCMLSTTMFISHSAEVAKTQHQNFSN